MKNIETNVIYIRGTTQFAVKLPLRVYQPLCLYAAITGSAYWVMSLWDFQLGRDKISIIFYRDRTIPDSLWKWFIESVFVIAFIYEVVAILARGKTDVKCFLNFWKNFFGLTRCSGKTSIIVWFLAERPPCVGCPTSYRYRRGCKSFRSSGSKRHLWESYGKYRLLLW